MPPYLYPVQRSIVVAAMAVHTFIIKEAIADKLFLQYQYEDVALEASNSDGINIFETDAAVNNAEQMEI